VPASLPVSLVKTSFDDDGVPADPTYEQRAEKFLAEFLWLTEAVVDKKRKEMEAV
jgi:hypothetical protein